LPTFNWIGKEAVVRHHKEVPFHLLEADPKFSDGKAIASDLDLSKWAMYSPGGPPND